MGVGGQRHASAAFTPGRDPVPVVQEAGWAPGPVWTGVEDLARTGIRSPDRPARSESLHRLSYRGPGKVEGDHKRSGNETARKRPGDTPR
jgi:hypothetical protein